MMNRRSLLAANCSSVLVFSLQHEKILKKKMTLRTILAVLSSVE